MKLKPSFFIFFIPLISCGEDFVANSGKSNHQDSANLEERQQTQSEGEDFESGHEPVTITGVNLTFDNARSSCQLLPLDAFRSQLSCRAMVLLANGDLTAADGLEEGISLKWDVPKQDNLASTACSHDQIALTLNCQLGFASYPLNGQVLQVNLEITDAVHGRFRSELTEVSAKKQNNSSHHERGKILYAINFNSLGEGLDPENWVDRGSNNDIAETDSFKTKGVAKRSGFGGFASGNNYHTNLLGRGVSDWSDYEFTGSFQISGDSQSYGWIVYADILAENYLRVRSTGSGIQIDRHLDTRSRNDGIGQCQMLTQPPAGQWHYFRIFVETSPLMTTVRAKFWPEGEQQDPRWDLQCDFDQPIRPTSGTVGLWGSGAHSMFISDLQVKTWER